MFNSTITTLKKVNQIPTNKLCPILFITEYSVLLVNIYHIMKVKRVVNDQSCH